ncbi:CheY chemotaxis protein or a CheY-like REC (receiver) domain [Pustulibacterium marinum]|uniref:CheY chemotaxis protein or a CheY-like REC (Receiver) domain n=1 Tax=Pustulibacterium marinum TaxID=1224947 RepID=A0A1I7HV45_9FLAO|nr:response regulator [Pustulibacterium marinum]SFU64573.1 CheY chemotaxis protein or a CheY-like REC (receiver) domain [Pustulibacterium marinum]
MKNAKIKILLVEDNHTDVQLTKRQIFKVDENVIVEVSKDLIRTEELLLSFEPNIVISDYRLPTCSGMDVLDLVERKAKGTTFIFLTGAIHDEELAANTILSGASGYFLKKNLAKFHVKLTPYINAVRNNSPITQDSKERITESRKTIQSIEDFLKNVDSINMSHIEGIQKIREDIAKLRKDYDNI